MFETPQSEFAVVSTGHPEPAARKGLHSLVQEQITCRDSFRKSVPGLMGSFLGESVWADLVCFKRKHVKVTWMRFQYLSEIPAG